MPTFDILLKGVPDVMSKDRIKMLRRINAPNREIVHQVLTDWDVLRWCVDDECPSADLPDDQVELVLGGAGETLKGEPHWPQLWKADVLRRQLKKHDHFECLLEGTVNLIETIDDTGGVTRDRKGCVVPVVDEEWLDLAGVYLRACQAAGIVPKFAEEEDDDTA